MNVKESAKDLGVIINKNLSFSKQISQVVKNTCYHLRNIAFLRKYLDTESMKKLVYNYVISKLDYCNSLYYGLTNYLLKKLQRIMNWAVHLIN